MKDKSCYFLLFIFILSIFAGVINGQVEWVDLDPPGTRDRYGTQTYCAIWYNILFKTPTIGSIGPSPSTPSVTGFTANNLGSNTTTTTYYISFMMPLGSLAVSFSLNLGGVITELPIETYSCEAVPLPDIELITSSFSNQYTYPRNIYYFYFRVKNFIKRHKPVLNSPTTTPTQWQVMEEQYESSNEYIFSITPPTNPFSTFTQNLTVSIGWAYRPNMEVFPLQVMSPFANVPAHSYLISELVNYPPDTSKFIDSYTMFRLKTNVPVMPLIIFQYNRPIPVYGTPTDAIYFIALSNYADTNIPSFILNTTDYTLIQNYPFTYRPTYYGSRAVISNSIQLVAPPAGLPSTVGTYKATFEWTRGGIKDNNIMTSSGTFANPSYPFSIVYKNDTTYRSTVSLFYSTDMASSTYEVQMNMNPVNMPITPGSDALPPVIKSFKVTQVPNINQVIVSLHIVDDKSGFYILYRGDFNITQNDLVSGTVLDGIYEKVIFLNYSNSYKDFDLCDFAENCQSVSSDTYLNADVLFPPRVGLEGAGLITFSLDGEITAAYFEKNNIDTTNQTVSTTMYFNVTNPIKYEKPYLSFPFQLGDSTVNKIFFGHWNDTSKIYEIPFTLPKNMFTGNVLYSLTFFGFDIKTDFLFQKFPTSILSVSSADADSMGPVLTSFDPYPSQTVTVSSRAKIGWTFTIIDRLNGFSNGSLTITNDMDQMEYTINFNVSERISGDKFNSTYRMVFTISPSCLTKTFSILKMTLIDEAGYRSGLSKYDDTDNAAFMNFLNGTANYLLTTCAPPTDTTPPTITSFVVSPTTVDVGSENRDISFTLNVTDPSGLTPLFTPTIYLSASKHEILECKTILKFPGAIATSYGCSMTLPRGFGLNRGFILSVYGVVDAFSNMAGFAGADLAPNQYYVPTTYSNTVPDILTVDYISRLGQVYVYGYSFGLTNNSQVLVDMLDGSGYKQKATSFNSSVLLVAHGVVTNSTFRVQVLKVDINGNLLSREYEVKFQTNDIIIDSSSSSSPASSSHHEESSSEEIIPIQCAGSPMCGGEERGVCLASGCQCIHPWTGIDCLAKPVSIPVPVTNKTSPTTEFVVKSETNTKTSFKNSISVISLLEKSNDGATINEYPFSLWEWSQETTNGIEKNIYINTFANKNDQSPITLTVSTQYFHQDTNVTFAGTTYLLNQYSIKFSINITKYTFTNSLNTLQVIMAASMSVQDADKDVCSGQEFGTLASRSEYFKLKVDDHSLYGKFIKKGIIDGKIQSIHNSFLGSDAKLTNKPKEASTLIGIDVGFYQKSVSLDPDFSVLVELSKAKDTCDSAKKSGLTTPQLVGIIIAAAVVFIAIIIVSAIMISRKYRFTDTVIKMRFMGRK
ncbi:hypothetical protein CYY_002824 [Polysphondylium violaceum]|uniref:EGF-like domain-containing protein n=1 Tax=Polysphondylium violaceum TaxID=133409 RepID=A0A8J4PVQ9_9MYCE|nr:hypothetical protein CYY_002824 [Polysphondylium violaceum]